MTGTRGRENAECTAHWFWQCRLSQTESVWHGTYKCLGGKVSYGLVTRGRQPRLHQVVNDGELEGYQQGHGIKTRSLLFEPA